MKYKILLLLFIISFISSLSLSILPQEKICDNSCEAVQKSGYSSFFGIKDSHYGVVIFAYLSFMTLSQIKHPRRYKKDIIHLGIIIGSFFATYFLYLQRFVIGNYCKFCIVVDISLLTAFGIMMFRWKK